MVLTSNKMSHEPEGLNSDCKEPKGSLSDCLTLLLIKIFQIRTQETEGTRSDCIALVLKKIHQIPPHNNITGPFNSITCEMDMIQKSEWSTPRIHI